MLQTALAGLYAKMSEPLQLGFSSAVKKFQGSRRKQQSDPLPTFGPDPLLVRIAEALARPRFEGATSAVLLSHDVDYFAGYTAVLGIAEAEHKLGLKSLFCFLANAGYRLERHVLEELLAMGHEVGLHGWDYDLRLAWRPTRTIVRKLRKGKARIEEMLGRAIRGFRNHSLLLTANVLEALCELGLRYDTGVYARGDMDPVSRWFCWPFRYADRPLWEIPVTWPQDTVPLRTYLLSDKDAGQYYRWTLETVRELNGVACFNFHPRTIALHAGFYTSFLAVVRDSGMFNCTPAELVDLQEAAARDAAAGGRPGNPL